MTNDISKQEIENVTMPAELLVRLLREAYMQGFTQTGCSYNFEWPFHEDEGALLSSDHWLSHREATLSDIMETECLDKIGCILHEQKSEPTV